MSDTPGGADWIQASDRLWYPPEQIVGWERRADGKWYEVDNAAAHDISIPAVGDPEAAAEGTPPPPDAQRPVMTLTTGGSRSKPLSHWEMRRWARRCAR